MKLLEDIELLKYLSSQFGCSGYEDDMVNALLEQIGDSADAYVLDRVGNLTVKICGRGYVYDAKNPRKVMVTSNMDEIGFMIKKITDDGYLKFEVIGNTDTRMLCGRRVTIRTENGDIVGIIASKAIHLQSKEERASVTPWDKLYIDIGAKDGEEAEKLVQIGDYAVLRSEFSTFGQEGKYICGKALQSRLGCAAMVETIRAIHGNGKNLPFDLYFTFTKCGEIGLSGAEVTARAISPDYCIALSDALAADYAGVSEPANICKLGCGAVIPFADADVIYDRSFIEFALSNAEMADIKTQIKQSCRGVSGDAGKIHKSGYGVRTMSLQFPVRNTGSAYGVSDISDYRTLRTLLCDLLENWKMN